VATRESSLSQNRYSRESKIEESGVLTSVQEAAALYTLKTLSPSTLQVGRKFVVCDAGGGTVDLISYQVTKIGRVEVKEVTEGTGGKCGSSMLNMRFRRHLKQTHGDKYWTDERLVPAMNEFESVSILKSFSLDQLAQSDTVQKDLYSKRRALDSQSRSQSWSETKSIHNDAG
jgi:hypothetical protein